MNDRPPKFSVVVPFYNEADILPSFLPEIAAAMIALDTQWEAILVNDGSKDNTGSLLEQLTEDWPRCRVVHHATNAGQAAALWTAFSLAEGPWVITLDGDGQNVPGDVARLIPLCSSHDMIVGVRVNRSDTLFRRTLSRVANSIRRKTLSDGMTDSGCALKVFRREVVGAFLPIRSLYSFIPAFAAHAGYRVAEVAVSHRERTKGKSNYGLLSFSWHPLADMISIWWLARRRIPKATSLALSIRTKSL